MTMWRIACLMRIVERSGCRKSTFHLLLVVTFNGDTKRSILSIFTSANTSQQVRFLTRYSCYRMVIRKSRRHRIPIRIASTTISTPTACIFLLCFLPRFVNNLPYTCSRSEFRSFLKDKSGVYSIYTGHPLVCPPPALARFAWITTDTLESAKKIVEELSEEREFLIDPITREKGRIKLNCSLQQPFKKSHRIPAVLNNEDMIAEDLDLLMKLLHTLETYWVKIWTIFDI